MWEQIRSNRRRSVGVVLGMAALLLLIGAAVGVLLAGEAGLLIGLAVGAVLWLILWLTAVSGGDDLMMSIAKAREVPAGEMQQLRNVLEEMSIAASLDRVPRLYVIDDQAPNAFATGRRPEKAAVAVTTGLLATLDRDELQGVVAHEIGHIKNQDVRLMVLAGVMLGCIVMLADVGRNVLWFGGGGRRGRSDSGGGNAIAAVVAILVIVLGPLLAQLFYFSLSRRREYLADASAAAFTRYPEGLARALEKIGGAAVATQSTSRVTAPMYISAPVMRGARRRRSGRVSAFSTHPPIEERVRILRGMAGGAGVADYLSSYAQTHEGSPLLGGRRRAGGPAGAAAAAFVDGAPGAKARVASPESGVERAGRAREASDALLHAAGYQWRECGACGATAKLPPRLAGTLQTCPRCRTLYDA